MDEEEEKRERERESIRQKSLKIINERRLRRRLNAASDVPAAAFASSDRS